ncbi:glycerophosphodiester phosphodiesterase [Nonomuraea typhae]|uniref:glycerophosphodiester phosphodiesterase n=1 Tax=Nonomuraea typhae TaxID=2603600 RepID=A0ABW7YZB0_9ACTN
MTDTSGPRRPLVIAHRGASALRPEHTLAAYETAIALGADYIEPDLVATKDHVLVARHENDITDTTDVAARPEFAARRTTKIIDGRAHTGWFTEDFTLAELRTLRAIERLPDLRPANTAFDGLAQIPTFAEVVRLACEHGVGVYPETKHPTYFTELGLPLEEPMLDTLSRYGRQHETDQVFLQSFEAGNLRELRKRSRLPIIQLMYRGGRPYDGGPGYDAMMTPEGLAEVAGYADGIGVEAGCVLPIGPDQRVGEPSGLVERAHAAGLQVHIWTLRNENAFLPADHRRGDPGHPAYARAHGDPAGWLCRFVDLGVDGVFADDPGLARAVIG